LIAPVSHTYIDPISQTLNATAVQEYDHIAAVGRTEEELEDISCKTYYEGVAMIKALASQEGLPHVHTFPMSIFKYLKPYHPTARRVHDQVHPATADARAENSTDQE
jgi:hypothetical protein